MGCMPVYMLLGKNTPSEHLCGEDDGISPADVGKLRHRDLTAKKRDSLDWSQGILLQSPHPSATLLEHLSP